MNPSGEVAGVYDKVRLAPMGEYVPFAAILPLVQAVVPSAAGGLTPGDELKVFEVDGRKFGPLICFEVFFPGMAAKLRRMGADFIVVITNLGWFGASNAIPQEFDVARLRAIENRLPWCTPRIPAFRGFLIRYGRFTPMNSAVDRFGNYYSIRSDLHPLQTARHRLVSAFDLPAPAPHPFPQGPRILAILVVVIAAVMVAAGLVIQIRKRASH